MVDGYELSQCSSTNTRFPVVKGSSRTLNDSRFKESYGFHKIQKSQSLSPMKSRRSAESGAAQCGSLLLDVNVSLLFRTIGEKNHNY